MKRYFIDGSCECGRIDDAEAYEDENGEWIKYEDYEKEQANGIKPQLCDVLAELSEYEFYDEKEGFSVSLDDIRKILSKYFA